MKTLKLRDEQLDKAKKLLQAGGSKIVEAFKLMGYNTDVDIRNFDGTPERVGKEYFTDLVWPMSRINAELEKVTEVDFPMPGDAGLVIQDCVVIGVCPHHLLPVIHQIYVGYLPKDNESVIGMSKLIRITDALARRPILQEQLAIDIAATLFNGSYDDEGKYPTGLPHFESAGSFVVMGSVHSCMATRGVRSFSLAREAKLRGEFMNNPDLRSEAYRLISQFPSVQFPFKG